MWRANATMGNHERLTTQRPSLTLPKNGLMTREDKGKSRKNWSGKRDLNPRPSPWQGDALPLSYSRVRVTEEAGFYRPYAKTVKQETTNIIVELIPGHYSRPRLCPTRRAQTPRLPQGNWPFDSGVPASSVHLTDLRGLSTVSAMSRLLISSARYS